MSQDTGKQPTDLEIMMLLDGELTGTDASAVEAWLLSDNEAAQKRASVERIGSMVCTAIELEADAAEDKLSGLWAGIETSIHANGVSKAAANKESAGPALPSIQQQAEKRATEALVQKASWFQGWLGHVATGALVAAAVAVLMFVTRPERVVETKTTTVIKEKGPASVMPVVAKSQDPIVEELEVYEGTGTIMTIRGDAEDSGDDGTSAVIWISNDTDVVEDPI